MTGGREYRSALVTTTPGRRALALVRRSAWRAAACSLCAGCHSSDATCRGYHGASWGGVRSSPMAAFLFERLARSLLVLLGVVLVAYALVLATGDPAGAMVGPDAPPSEVARVRAELGYDQPLPVQLGRYVWKLLHGD